MLEKLIEYQKQNHLSNQNMAGKLGVSIEKFQSILNGSSIDIPKKIRNKINTLLEKDVSKLKTIRKNKPVNPKITKGIGLPKGISEISKNLFTPMESKLLKQVSNITDLSKPISGKMPDIAQMQKIVNPLDKILSGSVIDLINNPVTPSVLDDLTSPMQDKSFPTNSLVDSISGSTWIQHLLNEPYKKSSGLESIITTSSIPSGFINYLDNPIRTKPDNYLFTTSEIISKINNNPTAYDNFLGFNKALSKSIFPSTSLGLIDEIFKSDNFTTKSKELNTFDILSGNTFTYFDDPDIFATGTDLLDEINANEKSRSKAESLINEVLELINSEGEDVQEQETKRRFQSKIDEFALWISESFQKTQEVAKAFAQVIVANLSLIAVPLALLAMYQNSKGQLEIKQRQLEIINRLDKMEQNTKNSQKDNSNSFSPIKLQATTDVNLRKDRHNKSKKYGLVRKGQEVTLLEKKVKWIRIAYIDFETNKSMTGWVYGDYFDTLD